MRTPTHNPPAAPAVDAQISGVAAVNISNVSFTYPRTRNPRTKKSRRTSKQTHEPRHALNQLSLRIEAGESVALLGPNGSGKSTLLKMLATLLPSDTGSIKIFGETHSAAIRKQLGVVFQRPGLDANMTVRENLADSARLYGITKNELKTKLDAALHEVDLHDRKNALVKTLSGGLARRADLCRAMLHNPKLLLLDEPTTALDPTARRNFLSLLDERRKQTNLTILMTTHLTEEADHFDRVLFMHQGKIVADNTPAELRRNVGSTRVTVHDAQWNPPGEQTQFWMKTTAGWSLTIDNNTLDRTNIATELARQAAPFTIAPPTLADAFKQHTGETLTQQTDHDS